MQIKVIIENRDEEINIATVNADDVSSTVTITASYIKDCRDAIKKNSKPNNETTFAFKENFLNNNTKNDAIDRNNAREESNPKSTVEMPYKVCVSRTEDEGSKLNIANENSKIESVSDDVGSDEEHFPCDDHTSDLSCSNIENFTNLIEESELAPDDDSNIIESVENVTNLNYEAELRSVGVLNVEESVEILDVQDVTKTKDNVDSNSASLPVRVSPVIILDELKDPENTMVALKSMTYEVDDFLTLNNSKRKGEDDVEDLTEIFDENNELKCDFKEYYVVDTVIGKRYNKKSKQTEYLLRPRKCSAISGRWQQLSRTDSLNIPLAEPERLFIQCPRMYRPCKKRKLHSYHFEERLLKNGTIENQEYENNPIRFENKLINRVGEEDDLMQFSDSAPESSIPDLIQFTDSAPENAIEPSAKNLNELCSSRRLDDEFGASEKTMNEESENSLDVELPNFSDHFANVMVDESEFVASKSTSSEILGKGSTLQSHANSSFIPVTKSRLKVGRPKSKPRGFECHYCAFVSSSRLSLDSHERRHTGVILPCTLCKKSYMSFSGLRLHTKKVHPEHLQNLKFKPLTYTLKDSYKSENVFLGFKTATPKVEVREESLTILNNNVGEKVLHKNKTRTTQIFRRTVSSKHVKQESRDSVPASPESCSVEGTVMEQKEFVKVDKVSKTSDEPSTNNAEENDVGEFQNTSKTLKLECRLEKIDGSTKSSTDAEKLYTCRRCPYTTTCRYGIAAHYNAHKNLKPTASAQLRFKSKDNELKIKKSYICPTCEYVATNRQELDSHRRVHSRPKFSTPEGMFACRLCDRLYNARSSLIRHCEKHKLPIVLIKRCDDRVRE